jgi:hypothetical protein
MNPSISKWVILVSGVLTLTMVYALIAPQEAVRSNFGEALEGEVADIIVRNWGALIALIGAMLIYAAYEPPVRPLVLTVAGASKVIFISLVLSHGQQFMAQKVGIAVVIDSAMVLFYIACLWAMRRKTVAVS